MKRILFGFLFSFVALGTCADDLAERAKGQFVDLLGIIDEGTELAQAHSEAEPPLPTAFAKGPLDIFGTQLLQEYPELAQPLNKDFVTALADVNEGIEELTSTDLPFLQMHPPEITDPTEQFLFFTRNFEGRIRDIQEVLWPEIAPMVHEYQQIIIFENLSGFRFGNSRILLMILQNRMGRMREGLSSEEELSQFPFLLAQFLIESQLDKVELLPGKSVEQHLVRARRYTQEKVDQLKKRMREEEQK